MCGISGIISHSPVNQLVYDSLLLLQHRGQDAAGIATMHNNNFFMHKANGLVKDVFRTRNMRALPGTIGLGQVRYPTAGNPDSEEEAQPFYVNAPFGLMLVHNGNLTNTAQLRQSMFENDRRHINTSSDSEILLNVFADELHKNSNSLPLTPDMIFKAVQGVHCRVKGAYSVLIIIAGYGLLAFRDPYGIRPLVLGSQTNDEGIDYMFASESVAIDGLGFKFERDIKPAEAVFIDTKHNLFSKEYTKNDIGVEPKLVPCIFEYIYLARPDSCIDGVPVYEARLRMGEYLAEEIKKNIDVSEIDVVMPIPDSSRPSAMELANKLGLSYREGFFKNRYVGRTFIMPGQAIRKKSVRQKLNTLNIEFKDKNVLIIDDSIVRGTTSLEIVQMAKQAGAKKIIFASAAPPVKYPNVYGIDMPTSKELIASNRNNQEICDFIHADQLVYQTIEAVKQAVMDINPKITDFDASCFDGCYITGDITKEYLQELEDSRSKSN
ncbi:MAG: glutamine phosphoribosylpyrophosphate amidotransferase [Pseudomonadota bacterium]|jgi:amidophosphoribosyltransferase